MMVQNMEFICQEKKIRIGIWYCVAKERIEKIAA